VSKKTEDNNDLVLALNKIANELSDIKGLLFEQVRHNLSLDRDLLTQLIKPTKEAQNVKPKKK